MRRRIASAWARDLTGQHFVAFGKTLVAAHALESNGRITAAVCSSRVASHSGSVAAFNVRDRESAFALLRCEPNFVSDL